MKVKAAATAAAAASDPRKAAIRSLIRIEKDGRYSNLETESVLRGGEMTGPDRRLYSRLVYGAIERKITLDLIISQYSKLPPERLDPECRIALRLGLYQLLFSDRIPDHAAVSGTVGAVRERFRGYVNGVLRSFIRAEKKYRLPPRDRAAEYLSAAYSASPSVVSVLTESYGEERAEEILSSSAGERPICLRLNTLRSGASSRLPDGARPAEGALAGIAAFADALTPEIRRGIENGDWFVEDASSIIAAETLGALPGDSVADVCSAPGGKSFSTAIRMENRGNLASFDIRENKLSLVRDGAARLGIDIIRTERRDGRSPDESLFGSFDRVLVDAPCSGLGVIGKKPEIRYKSADEISLLPGIQRGILEASEKYVAPGGVIVYSTCTLNRKENEEVASSLFTPGSPFEPVGFDVPGVGKSEGGMLTIFPRAGEFPTDGFFIAAGRKKS